MNKFLQSVYREFSDKGEINEKKKKLIANDLLGSSSYFCGFERPQITSSSRMGGYELPHMTYIIRRTLIKNVIEYPGPSSSPEE